MSTRDEDEAWRAIVENYGDRPVLDEEPGSTAPSDDVAGDENLSGPAFGPQPRPEPPSGREPRPAPRPTPRPEFRPFVEVPQEQPEELTPTAADDEDAFVPPVPELPRMERRRLIAWIAVLGSPAAFVLGALADVNVGGTFAAVIALCFVAGVGALVFSMPKDPTDPWDDGARI